MTARRPEDIHGLFVGALEAGDLEGLMALYESGAVLVESTGLASGADAIRSSLAELLAMRPKLRSETTVAVRAGDVAMLRARWTMTGTDAGGAEVRMSGESTEVVRRQADGTWKCVIDAPDSAGPEPR